MTPESDKKLATPDKKLADRPVTIWLTDRSRYTTGTGRCGQERYLTNHFGPTGYGIVRKSESLPLATGTYAHQALEVLFRHLLETDTFPSVDLIREAIQTTLQAYQKKIEARGYAGLFQNQRADEVVREQQYLITGLIWATCHTVLPWLHQEFRVVQAEQESTYVLDCTCGLLPTDDLAQHDARDCDGVGLMLKQDVVAERRQGSGVAYFEAKTTGFAGDSWAEAWETKPQLALGTLGIPERLGKEITETYIIGLYKGSRKKSGEGEDQIVRQESAFCYGYCKPANPPLSPDDWLPSYQWTDDLTRETKRASRAHKKRGVWELEGSDWPIWLAAKAHDPTLQPAEFWIATLPKSVLEHAVFVVGPMNRQDAQIQKLTRQVAGEEQHWKQILWQLYDLQSQGHEWASETFQAALDRLVPASWDCRRFGKGSECQFVPICFRQEGWTDPLGGGRYVARRPHHMPELEQAISRGLLPESSDEAGDEE